MAFEADPIFDKIVLLSLSRPEVPVSLSLGNNEDFFLYASTELSKRAVFPPDGER